jgi:hypothetical protein
LLAATTIEFYKKDMKIASSASLLAFSVFYVGGILSSVKTAENLNSKRIENKKEELKLALFPEFIF